MIAWNIFLLTLSNSGVRRDIVSKRYISFVASHFMLRSFKLMIVSTKSDATIVDYWCRIVFLIVGVILSILLPSLFSHRFNTTQELQSLLIYMIVTTTRRSIDIHVRINYILNCNLLINCCIDGPNIHTDIYTQQDAKHGVHASCNPRGTKILSLRAQWSEHELLYPRPLIHLHDRVYWQFSRVTLLSYKPVPNCICTCISYRISRCIAGLLERIDEWSIVFFSRLWR
jgi:hypothetical protein